jgi:hypothetical protein
MATPEFLAAGLAALRVLRPTRHGACDSQREEDDQTDDSRSMHNSSFNLVNGTRGAAVASDYVRLRRRPNGYGDPLVAAPPSAITGKYTPARKRVA